VRLLPKALQLILASRTDAKSLLERALVKIGREPKTDRYSNHQFSPTFISYIVDDEIGVGAEKGHQSSIQFDIVQQVGIACESADWVIFRFDVYNISKAEILAPNIVRFIGVPLELEVGDCVLVDGRFIGAGLLRRNGKLLVDTEPFWDWLVEDVAALCQVYERAVLPALESY
jgi:hypothetical protein